MKRKNMGMVDRLIRVIIGLIIVGAGIWYQSWWGAIGLFPIITSVTGRCILYAPFGISTRKKKE